MGYRYGGSFLPLVELVVEAEPLPSVALLAGGFEFEHLDLWLAGFVHGTDPEHAEYWGVPLDSDQRLVEMAAFVRRRQRFCFTLPH